MFKFLFSRAKQQGLWDFHGGIHPPEMKQRSSAIPLRQAPLPSHFMIPLKQHLGEEGAVCVNPGERVLRGQPLTRGSGRMLPVHAPSSGVVTAIKPYPDAHPSGLDVPCIILEADGEDACYRYERWENYRAHPREALIARIQQFGIAGLGGAGFPTGAKIQGGAGKIQTLIINGAECEPYITADDRLMQDCAAQIAEGIRILAYILQPRETLLAIEDNKPRAISMLRAVLQDTQDIKLRAIPTKYPSGGAKQLTQILTGKQVPHGGRSSDIGVLMQNVGTAFAIKRAIIDAEPLTERVVTLTGEAISRPGNVWTRLGTPIRHLLEYAGYRPAQKSGVIMGGPLMGFTLPSLDAPVTKLTNCLLAAAENELGQPTEEKSCIRCSACAEVCPAELLPQQLYWFSKGQQHDKASSHQLNDCIECGACAWVCPSDIPLVHYFRQEKAALRELQEDARRATEAKARFEARGARLEREKALRQARHRQAAVQPSASDRDAIQAALARVKAKTRGTEGASPGNVSGENLTQVDNSTIHTAIQSESRSGAAEAAIARAKARKTASGPATQPAQSENSAALNDPRRAAVEAAIARAKARKTASGPATQPTQTEDAAALNDPHRAAAEAAIARAKARKAAAEAKQNALHTHATEGSGTSAKAHTHTSPAAHEE